MNYILFDDEARQNLLPFTFTRPVCYIRTGILTIKEKWEILLMDQCGVLTVKYLQKKFPSVTGNENVYICGSILPDKELANFVRKLKPGESLVSDGKLIAANFGNEIMSDYTGLKLAKLSLVHYDDLVTRLQNPWDIFTLNDRQIRSDFQLLTVSRSSQALSNSNQVISPENVFVEKDAKVECAIINAATGPVYIGKDAEVMEGAMIRGPFALCEGSVVKMGAKIYGATTFGPHCKVGGEVSSSVIFGYSNKAHDGFLGNSVIGEWCNLGADSNNSNLKNNYSTVKVWSYQEEDFVSTGLQFCGLMMGDHSKCSINTMFNTGTVVGVSANIFGTGFPPKLVPSFSWGGSEGFSNYKLDEAMNVAQRVYERRHLNFDEADKEIFRHLFTESTKFRAW
jgi:UDP-N-acetylglucosamine diphosphorylase/glucosamine-1-phosphate N-acetyltransferase